MVLGFGFFFGLPLYLPASLAVVLLGVFIYSTAAFARKRMQHSKNLSKVTGERKGSHFAWCPKASAER